MTAVAQLDEKEGSAGAPGERYPIIDMLRGVSILLVILLHFQLRVSLEPSASAGALPRALWLMLCRNGNEGVRIFFVISGFLITSTALGRWGSLPALDVAGFYRLRLARIAPPLLSLLLVLSVLHFVGADGYVIDARVGYTRALLAALTFHVNWLEASRSLYLPASWDVLWSLAVEEVFYLFFPLLCALYRWRRVGDALLLASVALGAVVRVWLVGAPMWQAKAYSACMDGIALGCLTAVATHGRMYSRRVLQGLAVGGSALLVAMLLLARQPLFSALAQPRLHLSLLSLGSAALLVAGTRLSLGPRLFTTLRPLRACGRLSYEIYLTHMFVVLAATSYMRSRAWPPGAPLAGALLVIGGAWALGALVERYLSSPANRWVRTAFRRGSSTRQAPTPAR